MNRLTQYMSEKRSTTARSRLIDDLNRRSIQHSVRVIHFPQPITFIEVVTNPELPNLYMGVDVSPWGKHTAMTLFQGPEFDVLTSESSPVDHVHAQVGIMRTKHVQIQIDHILDKVQFDWIAWRATA